MSSELCSTRLVGIETSSIHTDTRRQFELTADGTADVHFGPSVPRFHHSQARNKLYLAMSQKANKLYWRITNGG